MRRSLGEIQYSVSIAYNDASPVCHPEFIVYRATIRPAPGRAKGNFRSIAGVDENPRAQGPFSDRGR
jgi:hypothetical protein